MANSFTPGQKLTAGALNNLSQQADSAKYLTNINKYFNNSQTSEGQLQHNKLINEYGSIQSAQQFEVQTRTVLMKRDGKDVVEDAVYVKLDSKPVLVGQKYYCALDVHQEMGSAAQREFLSTARIPCLTFLLGWKTTAFGQNEREEWCIRLLKPPRYTAIDLFKEVADNNAIMFSAENDDAQTPLCYDDGFGWVWCGFTLQQLESFYGQGAVQEGFSMFLIELALNGDIDQRYFAWVITPSIIVNPGSFIVRQLLLNFFGDHLIDEQFEVIHVCQIPPISISTPTTGVLDNLDFIKVGGLPYVLEGDSNFDITYTYPPENCNVKYLSEYGTNEREIDNAGDEFPPYPDEELALMWQQPSTLWARKTALWLSCDMDEGSNAVSAFYTPLSVSQPAMLERIWKSDISADMDLSSHTAQFIPVWRLICLPGQSWSTVQYINKDPIFAEFGDGDGAKYKCGLSSNIVFGEEEADGYIPMDVLYI